MNIRPNTGSGSYDLLSDGILFLFVQKLGEINDSDGEFYAFIFKCTLDTLNTYF